jgi:hypothetical protein
MCSKEEKMRTAAMSQQQACGLGGHIQTGCVTRGPSSPRVEVVKLAAPKAEKPNDSQNNND